MNGPNQQDWQYRQATENSQPLNNRTKYCSGCKRHRSRAQYTEKNPDYCKICTLRGYK